ncbi:MAG: FAD-dependent oxidoreductase [Spirochaetales bacterium]|nr:FAD-dependent oxidoreductase [Spirochaetales bacterium]
MSELIHETDTDNFERDVLTQELALVDFYSTECPPCEALAAKFEPLSAIWGEHVRFVKIHRQANRELAKSLDVTGSPSLLFFKKGKVVGKKLTGGIRRNEILRNLEALVPVEVQAALRLKVVPQETHVDVLILGGGPAGLTAGIYLSQAHQKVIVVDQALPGGFVATTHQVSNYPGFIQAQDGYQLSHNMAEQAKANGVEFRSAVDLDEIDLENHSVRVDGWETIRARKLIIATGSKPKPLGVPGEFEYRGQGISYCATCDGKYYQDKEIIVIGGGNSAIEESLFLAKFASKITIVHRSSHLKANKEAQSKASGEPKMSFLLEHRVLEIKKYAPFQMGVVVEDQKTKLVREIPAHGVFIFIGFEPNVELFSDKLKLDPWGYVEVDAEMRTNLPDVFSAGDVNSKPFRQITTAVSDGTIAAIAATKELE